jgi:transcriptional regulator with XRE-family HTH domain
MTPSEALREVVSSRRTSGRSLAKQAGLEPSQVRRFLRGGVVTTTTFDALAGALGLRLVEVERRTRKPSPAKEDR